MKKTYCCGALDKPIKDWEEKEYAAAVLSSLTGVRLNRLEGPGVDFEAPDQKWAVEVVRAGLSEATYARRNENLGQHSNRCSSEPGYQVWVSVDEGCDLRVGKFVKVLDRCLSEIIKVHPGYCGHDLYALGPWEKAESVDVQDDPDWYIREGFREMRQDWCSSSREVQSRCCKGDDFYRFRVPVMHIVQKDDLDGGVTEYVGSESSVGSVGSGIRRELLLRTVLAAVRKKFEKGQWDGYSEDWERHLIVVDDSFRTGDAYQEFFVDVYNPAVKIDRETHEVVERYSQPPTQRPHFLLEGLSLPCPMTLWFVGRSFGYRGQAAWVPVVCLRSGHEDTRGDIDVSYLTVPCSTIRGAPWRTPCPECGGGPGGVDAVSP